MSSIKPTIGSILSSFQPDGLHKVFISYHHENDQFFKDALVEVGKTHNLFIDRSVDIGGISDELDDQSIRTKIRDEYLRDSTVTILLAGTETKKRKHIDWEIYSSMIDGKINKKSGILVINLPSVGQTLGLASHGEDEIRVVYPEVALWSPLSGRAEMERKYPHLPSRIIDNLVAPNARISVVPWDRLSSESLQFLINATFNDRRNNEFDLRRPMMKRNA